MLTKDILNFAGGGIAMKALLFEFANSIELTAMDLTHEIDVIDKVLNKVFAKGILDLLSRHDSLFLIFFSVYLI